MRRDAWLTYNKNQNRAALRKRRAFGGRKVANGLTYVELPCADDVIYCEACHGPVVNDELGRRRHSMKSAECRAAMLPMPGQQKSKSDGSQAGSDQIEARAAGHANGGEQKTNQSENVEK